MKGYIYLSNGTTMIGVDVDIKKTKHQIDNEFSFVVVGNIIVNLSEVSAIEFDDKDVE
jgi:uncharacterized protein YejL (UPF0352 family)